MSFIDLEEDFPKLEGEYKVKIFSTNKKERICKAFWKIGEGFKLKNDFLAPEEFIKGWSVDD